MLGGTFLSISNLEIPSKDANFVATVSYRPFGISPGVNSIAKESELITIGTVTFLSYISPRCAGMIVTWLEKFYDCFL